MATFFLDPVGGSDAADGTTFANRWKTLQSGATAARIAPGDVIRIIASPDPTSPGNADWTNASGTVTWAAAKNKVIDDCETNWTAAANVTCASETTQRKHGTNSQKITPATGFTTGKLAYRTLPATLDLSSYEQVSLWIRPGSPATAGQLELKLCSDTTGDTPVNTLSIPEGEFGFWMVAVLNNAAALGASIASIALYATGDPGTSAIYLDNIVACKAAASADCVTHEHVIGKNTVGEPDWYSILAITDSGVTLGAAGDLLAGTTAQPYRGTTETVATYLLLGMAAWTDAQSAIQDSGTDASPIIFSGGWDRTAMSTQSGVSYFNGRHYRKQAVSLGATSHIRVEGVGGLNLRTATVTCAGASYMDLDLAQSVGCGSGAYDTSGFAQRAFRLQFDAIHGVTNSAGMQHAWEPYSTVEVRGRRLHGCVGNAALQLDVNGRFAIDRIDNNLGIGASMQYITLGLTSHLFGTVFANNGTDIEENGSKGTLTADGCTFAAPTMYDRLSRIKASRYGGVANDHRVFAKDFLIASATDQRHTASGVSWKVSPLHATDCNSRTPASFTVARIAVEADALVTVKCWTRRSNTGLSVGLRIPAKSLPGVGDSDLQTLMTAAADTWEEITLTFTPTEAGVVDVLGVAWGGTSFSGWFDDLTPSQA